MTTQDPKVTLFGTEYPSLKEALHFITNGLIIPDERNVDHVNDAILGGIHDTGLFDIGKTVSVKDQGGMVYTVPCKDPVRLRDVSTNIICRLLYEGCMQTPLRMSYVIGFLRLSGIAVPPQFLCCSAAIATGPVGNFANKSGNRFSLCKHIIKSQGHSVVVDGKVAQDLNGHSIIDIAHTDNLKYVLQSVLDAGFKSLPISQQTWIRLLALAKANPKVLKMLDKLNIT